LRVHFEQFSQLNFYTNFYLFLDSVFLGRPILLYNSTAMITFSKHISERLYSPIVWTDMNANETNRPTVLNVSLRKFLKNVVGWYQESHPKHYKCGVYKNWVAYARIVFLWHFEYFSNWTDCQHSFAFVLKIIFFIYFLSIFQSNFFQIRIKK